MSEVTLSDGESLDGFLVRMVTAYRGEARGGSLVPFWDRLVAEGFTTSANDARRVLELLGAYDGPRVPFTRETPTRVNGVDTEHKRAIMRVTANIREAMKRATSGGALGVKSEVDRLAEIEVAVRRALRAGIPADQIRQTVGNALAVRL